VKPKEYLSQALDVISSNFESGKIDAAIVWEPTASRLVNAGIARRVGSGSLLDTLDAGFLVIAKDLLDERPDVAEAWMKAELDAQRYLADPANADEIARIAQE
jgi:sulfonate transport system substrate-binding protein